MINKIDEQGQIPQKERLVPEQLSCPICGLDGFENEDDLYIHLEDCDI